MAARMMMMILCVLVPGRLVSRCLSQHGTRSQKNIFINLLRFLTTNYIFVILQENLRILKSPENSIIWLFEVYMYRKTNFSPSSKFSLSQSLNSSKK